MVVGSLTTIFHRSLIPLSHTQRIGDLNAILALNNFYKLQIVTIQKPYTFVVILKHKNNRLKKLAHRKEIYKEVSKYAASGKAIQFCFNIFRAT